MKHKPITSLIKHPAAASFQLFSAGSYSQPLIQILGSMKPAALFMFYFFLSKLFLHVETMG